MKKLAAILLCLCMILGFTSCSVDKNGDVPDGMQIASAAGADYYLYVPTTWNINTYYGISGAYFNLTNLSNVSVKKYEQTDALKTEMQTAELADSASARIAWYYETYCKPTVDAIALGDSVSVEDAGTATTLDGENAMQFTLKATINGKVSRMHHVIAERKNAFYVFTFSVTEDLYEMLWTDVETMLNEFSFTDTPYEPDIAKEIDPDADAPEGMKLASNEEVAYRFYVPSSWVINENERVFAAYVEDDRANVSIVPYMPDSESMTIAEYSKMTKDKLLEIVGKENYVVVEDERETTLGGRVAVVHRYQLKIDGRAYEYLQIITTYKSMVYSLTYTAPTQEIYEKHIEEVERIIDAFAFR